MKKCKTTVHKPQTRIHVHHGVCALIFGEQEGFTLWWRTARNADEEVRCPRPWWRRRRCCWTRPSWSWRRRLRSAAPPARRCWWRRCRCRRSEAPAPPRSGARRPAAARWPPRTGCSSSSTAARRAPPRCDGTPRGTPCWRWSKSPGWMRCLSSPATSESEGQKLFCKFIGKSLTAITWFN